MFKNYLVITLRNLLKHKAFSAINIFGLAVGMACCILIFLFVQYEISFDRFHKNSDQIYRVIREEFKTDGNPTFSPGTSGALGQTLVEDFLEVEQSVRIVNRPGVWVSHNTKGFAQWVVLADETILKMFTFPLVKGDLNTLFENPYSIAVTQSTAKKYFGDTDPIGQVVSIKDDHLSGTYTITGILQDIPNQSTLHFDFLTTTVPRIMTGYWTGWRGTRAVRPIQTFVQLKEGLSPEAITQKLPDFIERYMGADIRSNNAYYLQPLNQAYLYSKHYANVDLYDTRRGDISQIYMLFSIGLFLMLIACINFMNLSTARSANRIKEVGMRKVLGANNTQLLKQFLGESILTSVLALLLAVILASLVLPEFNTLMQKELTLNIWTNQALLFGLMGFALIVGFLSGSYPAFFLSSLQPAASIKGASAKHSKMAWFRKGLVVFQFSISVVLMIGTTVVYGQLAFIDNKDLGFHSEALITCDIFARDRSLEQKHETVRQRFLQHPNVINATVHRYNMGWDGGGHYKVVQPEGKSETWRIKINEGDTSFLDTFGMKLLSGRNFSEGVAGKIRHEWLLNETAIKQLGWTNPIGKQFRWGNRTGLVVGVIQDFHGTSLREKIEPIAIANLNRFNFLTLKMSTNNVQETMTSIEKVWKQFVPHGVSQFQFMDENFARLYDADKRTGKMFGIFSLLAILIANLGLFALSSFTVQKRIKEVGIRKVLGASIFNILLLLSKDFLKLVLIANLIAWPIAYYVMNQWLQEFAYRIDLGFDVFILSGFLSLFIALGTVSFQATKAATANPVDAIQYE